MRRTRVGPDAGDIVALIDGEDDPDGDDHGQTGRKHANEPAAAGSKTSTTTGDTRRHVDFLLS
jgi:hypothetical protein